ncbi:hypothetical protein CLV56_2308 [Mumia flava]|uniref:CopC domain-containing protein n=1 Tax=Mumia flava TaxID=1348852 RepID=A0A2M9BJF4_9ACTN|nr:copper resistance CopC family protein [Mumia flava]PJJ58063.1 hypothetical protein CLV56_2308 [Mumia flava]
MSLSRTGRAILVSVLVVASSSIALPSASAHASLVSSSPSDGEVLDEPPRSLSLTFTDDLMDTAPALVLLDGEGSVVAKPEPTVEGDTLLAAGPSDLLPGDYTIGYRVVSADGHPVDGEIDFTIEGEPAAATTAPESATPSSDATAGASPDAATGADVGGDEADGDAIDGTSDDSSVGPWAFGAAVAATVAVLAAAAIWLTRRRRRDTTPPTYPSSGDSA